MLRYPAALLLDFGGVIVEAPPQPPAPEALVRRIHQLIGGVVPTERITQALIDGSGGYAAWRDRVSAQPNPVELDHVQVWSDFVIADWPEQAREAVRRAATDLAYAWSWCSDWRLRPGIPEVLAAAAAEGTPVAVVSNALCGAAHRDFLAEAGLTGRFVVQLYSDEIGIRKPNPEMAIRAADELGVSVADCWFVGDSQARDIACARRAGVGAAVLMRSQRTVRDALRSGVAPDAVVDDGLGLLELLKQTTFGC